MTTIKNKRTMYTTCSYTIIYMFRSIYLTIQTRGRIKMIKKIVETEQEDIFAVKIIKNNNDNLTILGFKMCWSEISEDEYINISKYKFLVQNIVNSISLFLNNNFSNLDLQDIEKSSDYLSNLTFEEEHLLFNTGIVDNVELFIEEQVQSREEVKQDITFRATTTIKSKNQLNATSTL